MNFIAKLRGKRKNKEAQQPKQAKAAKKTTAKNAKEKPNQDPQQDYDIFIERPQLNVFLKLFYIILKNIQLLIRSRLSALVFIFGPLLIIFLVALAFNTSTLFDLNIAVYSDSYSTISNGIADNLSDSLYNVVKLNSEEDCVEAVKFQDFQVCLIFPANMVLDNSANNVVKIYVDNSRLNVAHLISQQISTKVTVEATEMSTGLVTEILTILDTTNTEAEQAKPTLASLRESNTQIRNSVSGISSNLNSVEFTAATVDTADIKAEIDDIEDENNLSSGLFTDLNALIESFEADFSSTVASIESAEEDVEAISESVPAILSQLDADKPKYDELDTKLDTITGSIDNIKITNVESIVSPIKTTIEPISSSNSYLLFLLPSILVVLIMFVALLMSSTSIIQEKTSQAYFRNFITPTNENLFMLGEFISNFMILLFQVLLMLAVLYYFLQDLGAETFVLVGAMLLLIGTFFLILGMFIGYIFNTKQTVTLAALTTGIIMLLFSNTLLPLETLSIVTREIVFYNPFLIGENVLKKIFLFGATFSEVAEFAYLLIGFSVAMLIGAFLARHFSKQSFNIQ